MRICIFLISNEVVVLSYSIFILPFFSLLEDSLFANVSIRFLMGLVDYFTIPKKEGTIQPVFFPQAVWCLLSRYYYK